MSYESIPTATAIHTNDENERTTVDIMAPRTLPEGYQLNAVYDGAVFVAIVPQGGVQQGETFTSLFHPNESFLSSHIPTRKWKDSLLDCFKYGAFHPSLLNAWCCPLILLGQIMTRLKLDWLANPAPSGEWKKTFRTCMYILITYFLLNMILTPPSLPNSPQDEANLSILNFTNLLYGGYILFITIKLRYLIRRRDEIPEQVCIGCEDCCSAFFLGCCTVSQLARQTANYDLEAGEYCSNTGIPESPAILVV